MGVGSTSTPKSNLPALLGRGSHVFAAASLLNKNGSGVTEGTVKKDLLEATSMLETEFKRLLRARKNSTGEDVPVYVWIGSDEASSKHDGGQRPMCIIIGCEELGIKPFVVDLVFSSDMEESGEGYTEAEGSSSGSGSGGGGGAADLPSVKAARAILRTMERLDPLGTTPTSTTP